MNENMSYHESDNFIYILIYKEDLMLPACRALLNSLNKEHMGGG